MPLAIAQAVADKFINETSFDFKLVPQSTVLGVQVVDFRRTLGEPASGLGYALSTIISENDTTLSFGSSSSGGVKIWLNDRMIFKNTKNTIASVVEIAYNRFAFQDTIQFKLHKGANKILVKAAAHSGQWKFFLRPMATTDADEAPAHFSIKSIAPDLESEAWLLIGPFPHTGSDGLELVFPPEKEIRKSYEYENQVLAWTVPKRNVLLELVIPRNATYKREAYADWHYAIGATMLALLAVADETGEKRYADFVERYCDFILAHVNYFQWQYESLHAFRGSYHRLFRRTMLDDTGAPSLPFVELLSREPSEKYQAFVAPIAEYVLRQQVRLPDGTFCRPEPEPNTVWADDLFMSGPFLLRMGKITGERIYFDEAAQQIPKFAALLWDKKKQLFHHGWFSTAKKNSVAFWGRANGWMIWAMSEALLHLPSDHPSRAKIRQIFREHVASLAKYQGASGLWHQVLDHSESYEETSCSAMFVLAMTRGVTNGWIDQQYQENAFRGWRAIEKKIEADGTVHGICRGTGIGEDLDFYFNRATFDHDPRGLGAVITAGLEVAKLSRQ
jgi:rhamnogalacturonyl hydrolase YesR